MSASVACVRVFVEFKYLFSTRSEATFFFVSGIVKIVLPQGILGTIFQELLTKSSVIVFFSILTISVIKKEEEIKKIEKNFCVNPSIKNEIALIIQNFLKRLLLNL